MHERQGHKYEGKAISLHFSSTRKLFTSDCDPLETIHFSSKIFFYTTDSLRVICIYRLKPVTLYITYILCYITRYMLILPRNWHTKSKFKF